MSEVSTTQSKINRPMGALRKSETPNRKWTDGYVYTENGTVIVYQEEQYGAALVFGFRGMLYDRQFARSFSDRYLVTLADRFAREVVENADNGR